MIIKDLQDLKLIRDMLSGFIEKIEADTPYQSEVGKTFQQKLMEKMEKKDGESFYSKSDGKGFLDQAIEKAGKLKIQGEL